MVLRSQVFKLFFMRCPSGQDLLSVASKASKLEDFFKQSNTRLYFILDKNFVPGLAWGASRFPRS